MEMRNSGFVAVFGSATGGTGGTNLVEVVVASSVVVITVVLINNKADRSKVKRVGKKNEHMARKVQILSSPLLFYTLRL